VFNGPRARKLLFLIIAFPQSVLLSIKVGILEEREREVIFPLACFEVKRKNYANC
jgi:hypothetical protein